VLYCVKFNGCLNTGFLKGLLLAVGLLSTYRARIAKLKGVIKIKIILSSTYSGSTAGFNPRPASSTAEFNPRPTLVAQSSESWDEEVDNYAPTFTLHHDNKRKITHPSLDGSHGNASRTPSPSPTLESSSVKSKTADLTNPLLFPADKKGTLLGQLV